MGHINQIHQPATVSRRVLRCPYGNTTAGAGEKKLSHSFFSPQSIVAFATRLPAELPLTAPAENSYVNALNHPHSMRMIHRFQRYNAM